MNKNEKKYLFNECETCYLRCFELKEKDFALCLVELGKARALKQVIEKYVDCQDFSFYERYMRIVRFENIASRVI